MTRKLRYKIISEFDCSEKHMIVVKIGAVVHVMDYDEWRKVYGRYNLNKWNKLDKINEYATKAS